MKVKYFVLQLLCLLFSGAWPVYWEPDVSFKCFSGHKYCRKEKVTSVCDLNTRTELVAVFKAADLPTLMVLPTVLGVISLSHSLTSKSHSELKWLRSDQTQSESSLWYFLYLFGSCICVGALWQLGPRLPGQKINYLYSWSLDGGTKQWLETIYKLLKGNQSIQIWTKLSSLNITITVTVAFSSFWNFCANLKVWDPNLKVFSSLFSKPQSLGVSEVGRSEAWVSKFFKSQRESSWPLLRNR